MNSVTWTADSSSNEAVTNYVLINHLNYVQLIHEFIGVSNLTCLFNMVFAGADDFFAMHGKRLWWRRFQNKQTRKFALLKRSIKLISHVCGLSFGYLTNFVTLKHPPNLLRGFLEIISTPCMRSYQRQGHTPPPGVVSHYFPQRLLCIGILYFRHCHDFWFTEPQSGITTYRSCLDVCLPPLS